MAPTGAGEALPSNFRVERRLATGTDYTEIATLPNEATHKNPNKIKIRDTSAVPGVQYRYRVVVAYPNGHEATLRESKAKSIPRGSFDYDLQAVSTPEGIQLSWKPALWEAAAYYVLAKTSSDTRYVVVGAVAHDSSAERLTFTHSDAVPGTTYDYQLNVNVTVQKAGEDPIYVTATKE